ncbi:hypothetical protein [Feifania hominis]|uniref:Uncharacterized protein n=1 Tax=Feifania hominis TaxID=2763660 RepID=A0A926DCB3_9FIRM|nr:hypothetical protein [Feifania hominis]MBC8535227.1 hypothetical protein [Feifania hominis]
MQKTLHMLRRRLRALEPLALLSLWIGAALCTVLTLLSLYFFFLVDGRYVENYQTLLYSQHLFETALCAITVSFFGAVVSDGAIKSQWLEKK